MATSQNIGQNRFFGIDLEKTFRVTAEISSVALLIGFVASAAINQIVFASWGLNFVSFAAPSDVIMSGIGFLLDTGLPMFIAIVTLIAPDYFGWRYKDHPILRWAILAGMLAVAVFLALFLQGIAERANAARESFGGPEFSDAYLVTVLVLSLAIAMPCLMYARANRVGRMEGRPKAVFYAVLAASVVFGALSLANIVKLRADLGYQRVLSNLQSPSEGRCSEADSIVLWLGSEWVVARCGEAAPFAIKADTVTRVSPSNLRGYCNALGALTLWECAVRKREGPPR